MTQRSKQERIKDPINVDDYKLLTKALKLKILKQSKIVEELQTDAKSHLQEIINLKKTQNIASPKNRVQQNKLKSAVPDKTGVQVDTLNGKKQVMNAFRDSAAKFGISPESLFRIIDVQYRGQVDSDTFRKALSKINLNLCPKQISCLIYIFDENCTGNITRQQFTDALQAYQVSSQIQHTDYMNQSLNKLANLMQQSNTNFRKFFDEMEAKSKKSVTLDIFGNQIKSIFSNKIQQKQIVAAFNQIDLQNDDFIDRQNFIYGIQSSLNRQLHDKNTKKNSQVQDYHQDNRNMQSNLSYKSDKKYLPLISDAFEQNRGNGSPKKNPNQMNSDIIQQNKQSAINIKVPVSQIIPEDLFQKYLQQYKIDLRKIYEELSMVPMPKRMTLYSFKKAINYLASKGVSNKNSQNGEVNPELLSKLFKIMDFNQKGSLGFSELIYFYLQHGKDMAIILRLIGKYFYNNDLNSERFFFLFGINPDTDISKSRFIQILNKTFLNPDPNSSAWEKFWAYFDKGRGVQSVSFIIKEMQKFDIQQ